MSTIKLLLDAAMIVIVEFPSGIFHGRQFQINQQFN